MVRLEVGDLASDLELNLPVELVGDIKAQFIEIDHPAIDLVEKSFQ
jgi:hypothetical protein